MTQTRRNHFRDAVRSLDGLRPILAHAREVEFARLSAFLSGVTASVSRVEGRLKDNQSIIDNYLLYRDAPSETVQFVDFLESVTDLIGLRVVVMYDSDVDSVANHLSSSYGTNFEQVFTVADMTGGATFGYRATHWKFPFQDAAFDGTLGGFPISCEVQVRTVLSDAWAQHSHKMIYKNPSISLAGERIFARIAAALEGLDADINRLATEDGAASLGTAREDFSLILARQEAYDLLRGAVSPSISDAAVAAALDQAGTKGLIAAEDRIQFIEDLKNAIRYSKEEKLDRYGIVDDVTKLKIGFFWTNRRKYADMVPPHLRARSIDMLLVG
jgi:ppGpp synthetase/RelA/SpoT-type nucleotidyltranferase